MELNDLCLVIYPDPRLRLTAGPAPPDRDLLRRTSRALFDLMYAHRGRGFAAVQAGLPWRMFVVNAPGDPNQPDQERVFINPEVVAAKPRRARDEEGCLSIPGLYADVERPKTIKVRYTDLDGQTVEATYDGTMARIFQHELDHLDGVLFIDRLEPELREKVQPFLDALAQRTAQPDAVAGP